MNSAGNIWSFCALTNRVISERLNNTLFARLPDDFQDSDGAYLLYLALSPAIIGVGIYSFCVDVPRAYNELEEEIDSPSPRL